MIGGGFEAGVLAPLGLPLTLLAVLATGAWAALAGGAGIRQLPLAALLGVAIGVLLAELGVALPREPWLQPASVVVLGVAAAVGATRPGAAVLLVIAAAFIIHGHEALYASRALLGWVGVGVGLILGMAAGIGLAVIFAHGSRAALRLEGAIIAVVGVLILYEGL